MNDSELAENHGLKIQAKHLATTGGVVKPRITHRRPLKTWPTSLCR